MKGNKGDQNYEVPTNIDLSQYQSVTIWCGRFGVNFATAPLTPPNKSRARERPCLRCSIMT